MLSFNMHLLLLESRKCLCFVEPEEEARSPITSIITKCGGNSLF